MSRGVLYAAAGETLGFTTSVGETALAVNAGTLTQNGADASLTMPAENVSVYRNVDLRYDIHFDADVPGCCFLNPSRRSTCAGDVVRVYNDPENGYILDELTVVDSQNEPVAVTTDENGDPCFVMPASEVYLTVTYKKKYSYNADTGELRLLCGDFGETNADRWADGDNWSTMFRYVKSVTADPGVRFVGRMDAMFSSFVSCESFDLHNVDVSEMTSTTSMFSSCWAMTSLNISGWDLSHVTDAHGMFVDCRALTSFSFDILSGAPLADISGMFNSCPSLTSVDLTAHYASALPDMTGIFSGCPKLHSVTLAPGMSVTLDMDLNNDGWGWIADGTCDVLCYGEGRGTFTAPAKATDTTFVWATDVLGERYGFDDSTGALTLNWGTFNPSDDLWTPIRNNKSSVTSVTANPGVSFTGDCSQMFRNWENCVSMDLSAADTSGMTSMEEMFCLCDDLTTLDVSGWDTSHVTNMTYVFQYCTHLDSVDVSGWNTSQVTTMEGMFQNCEALTSLDLSRFDISSLTTLDSLFVSCTSLVSVNLSGWDVSGLESLSCLFTGCYDLETVNLKGWRTSSITDMSSMFSGCSSLTSLDLRHFDVSSVESFDCMFGECSSLTSLDISGWDTSSAASMMSMFSYCSSLTSLDLSGFDVSGVFDVSNMFLECTSLVSLNISGFDLSEAESNGNAFDMFTGDASLCLIMLSPDMSVTEDMCLANGEGGWIASGDPTETRASGIEENAVISATGSTVTYVNRELISSECGAAMGAAADSSKIRADLYFDIPDGVDPHFFTVTIDGAESGLGSLSREASGYKFSVTKPAKNMGDMIAYSLKIGCVTVKSGEVSVKAYAENLAAIYPEYSQFTAAMLAYGAAAQTYFGCDAANLVSDADLTALAPVAAERFNTAAIQSAMIADSAIPVHYSAMNVTFLADTTLSIAFRIKDGFTNDEALEWVNANVMLGGESVEGKIGTSGDYRFVIISKQNIAITDIDATMYLVVGTAGIYGVSVMQYFAAVEAQGGDSLKLLTRALYAYSQEAKAIAGN